ncbi:N-acetyl-alpha-D-glucosaminyl L-malate synthase BshA [bacterium]|nr:N-acetyl-alpha-D-glucosaminyl L-malate synthase BshA [bacterium]NUN47124.1 N-acetyl-alpha-D-glucosaminyl L-malate synthase BshA [bacterium]
MKIGVTCYPTYGGSGVVATELGIELAKRGHDIHFITSDIPFRLNTFRDRIYFHAVEVMNYPVFDHSPYSLSLAARMAEVAEFEDLDLLHVHYAIPHAPSAYLAKQIIRKNNRIKDLKTVTTLHGTDITLLGMDRSFLNLIKFSIDESDGTTSVSKYLRNRTYGEFKPNRKIEVIPNFVDTEKYRPHDKPEDSSHGFLSRITPNHEKLIMHISNFRPVKRVGDVVKIFAKVRENINAKLLLIGDGPERRMCEQLVQDFGLDEHVVFLGKQEAVAELICCAHVFLLPSEEESFGLAALEAMAAGVPCVTSNAGGLSEVNIHNETGYLEKIGDVDAMAADVVKILTDQELYQRFRANARQRVVDNFGTDRVVQQYIDYYQKVIEGKNT